jgi:hypothetical protein
MMLCMAYDEDLADRIRELIAGDPDVTEQRMFGGLAFLVAGNMSVAASGQGGLMVRVDPAETDSAVVRCRVGCESRRRRAYRARARTLGQARRRVRPLACSQAVNCVDPATYGWTARPIPEVVVGSRSGFAGTTTSQSNGAR